MEVQFYGADKKWGELSNFWVLGPPIVYLGKSYPTSEHLYQALKFLYDDAPEDNESLAEHIRKASTPYKAKILGGMRTDIKYPWQKQLADIVKHHPRAKLRPDWEEVKNDAMLMCLALKFTCDAHCRMVLLDTGTRPLSEHSTDRYWGDGGGSGPRGQNWLGGLLVRVREALQNETDVLELTKGFSPVCT